LNGGMTARTFAGTASSFTGPGTNWDYTIVDGTSDFGTVPCIGGTSCTTTGDCYTLQVARATTPNTSLARPDAHWDATFVEDVGVLNVLPKRWSIHVGDSFSDVPRSNPFYRFVETLLHNGVTGGCTPTSYCPDAVVTRGEIAALLLLAREGGGYVPPPCTAQTFNDVPVTSPQCPWIQELVRRRVITGCSRTRFCPMAEVTREQIATLLLTMKEPDFVPAACGTPMFSDVPASSPFCPAIEELARRGVVSGCSRTLYCPTQAVSRAQASVFLTGTFGLALYGP
jgi:hypothetical protein